MSRPLLQVPQTLKLAGSAPTNSGLRNLVSSPRAVSASEFVAGVVAAVAIATVLVVGVVVWSASTPGRSLQDRLAGTWLVPR